MDKNDDFERLAKGLLEYETLTGDQIRKVIAGEALDSPDDVDKPPSGGVPASVTALPKTKPRVRKADLEPKPSV